MDNSNLQSGLNKGREDIAQQGAIVRADVERQYTEAKEGVESEGKTQIAEIQSQAEANRAKARQEIGKVEAAMQSKLQNARNEIKSVISKQRSIGIFGGKIALPDVSSYLEAQSEIGKLKKEIDEAEQLSVEDIKSQVNTILKDLGKQKEVALSSVESQQAEALSKLQSEYDKLTLLYNEALRQQTEAVKQQEQKVIETKTIPFTISGYSPTTNEILIKTEDGNMEWQPESIAPDFAKLSEADKQELINTGTIVSKIVGYSPTTHEVLTKTGGGDMKWQPESIVPEFSKLTENQKYELIEYGRYTIETPQLKGKADIYKDNPVEDVFNKIVKVSNGKINDVTNLLYPYNDLGIELRKLKSEYPDLAKEFEAAKTTMENKAKSINITPEMSLEQYTADYAGLRGITNANQILDLTTMFNKDVNNIKTLAGMKYKSLYGSNQETISQGQAILSMLFPPARALYPEVTIDDITDMEWALGGAQIALLSAPAVGSIVGKAASPLAGKLTSIGLQSAAGVTFTAETIANWDNMTDSQKIISGILDLVVVGSVLGELRGIRGTIAKAPKTEPVTNISKVKIPSPPDVKQVMKLAKTSGNNYKIMRSNVSDLAKTEFGSSEYAKLAAKTQSSIQKSLASDKEFLNKLQSVKTITNKEINQLESVSKITGIKQSIKEINGSLDSVNKAWNNVEKIQAKYNKSIASGKASLTTERQLLDSLKRLDDAKAKLSNALEDWTINVTKPRYRLSYNVSDVEVINALDTKLGYAKDELSRAYKYYNDAKTTSGEREIIRDDIFALIDDIDDMTYKRNEYIRRMNSGESLPIESQEYYTASWSEHEPTWGGKPKSELEPKQPLPPTSGQTVKMFAKDMDTGKIITIEKELPAAKGRALMEQPDQLTFDLKLEPQYKIRQLSDLPESQIQVPKMIANRDIIYKTTNRLAVNPNVEIRAFGAASPTPSGAIITSTIAGTGVVPMVMPVIVPTTMNPLTETEIKLGSALQDTVKEATKAYDATLLRVIDKGLTDAEINTELQQAVDAAIKNQLVTMTDLEIADQIKVEYSPMIQQLVLNETQTNPALKLQIETQPLTRTELKTKTATKTRLKTKEAIRERIRTTGKVRIPPPIILKLPKGKGKVELTPEQYAGIVAWKQGFVFYLKYPDAYGKYPDKNTIVTREQIEGVEYAEGVGSVQESIIAKGGRLPDIIEFDMGIQDVKIVPTWRADKPDIDFDLDRRYLRKKPKQKHKMNEGIRMVR